MAAVETKTTKPTKVKLQPKAPTTIIVHPLTGQRFEGAPVEVEIDNFLQSQIDADKLEVV